MLVQPEPNQIEFLIRQRCAKNAIAQAKQLEHPHPNLDVLSMYASHGRHTTVSPGVFTPPTSYHAHDDPNYKPSQNETISELLHIARPVVYALLSLKRGKPGWNAFLISLLFDLLSRSLASSMASLSLPQQAESSQRTSRLGFYLFREPFFTNYTRKPLEMVVNVLSKIPILGGILANIIQVLLSLQQYHFYISASS